MPGSNQKTRLSAASPKGVYRTTIIEFYYPPRYRNKDVDISLCNKVEYYGDNNQMTAGNRAIVRHRHQSTRKCKIYFPVGTGSYKIIHQYTGTDVSEGVEEV